jgi:hypothetical protein
MENNEQIVNAFARASNDAKMLRGPENIAIAAQFW